MDTRRFLQLQFFCVLSCYNSLLSDWVIRNVIKRKCPFKSTATVFLCTVLLFNGIKFNNCKSVIFKNVPFSMLVFPVHFLYCHNTYHYVSIIIMHYCRNTWYFFPSNHFSQHLFVTLPATQTPSLCSFWMLMTKHSQNYSPLVSSIEENYFFVPLPKSKSIGIRLGLKSVKL